MKIKNSIYIIPLLFFFFSCKTEGVKGDTTDSRQEIIDSKSNIQDKRAKDLVGVKDSAYRNLELLITDKQKINRKEKYDNGVVIEWIEEGKGAALKDYHAYKITYEVLLDDGTVIDGNKIANRDWVHFILGYQLQGKGWDYALNKLKIGDFARISIPSKLARGKEGIKGLVPPDANNTVVIKILGEIEPDKKMNGTNVWVLASTFNEESKVSDTSSKVIADYTVSTPSNPRFLNTQYSSTPFIFQYKEKGIIEGLKKAMIGVKRGDNLWISVDPKDGYGKAGFTELVKPNEHLFYEMLVYDVK